MKALRELNSEVRCTAKHPDAGLYVELPYDLQGLVRRFTPHPVSLLIHEAHYVFELLQDLEKEWPHREQKRLRRAHTRRRSNVKVAHFNWLGDRDNLGIWSRARLDQDRSDDEYSSSDDPYESRGYF